MKSTHYYKAKKKIDSVYQDVNIRSRFFYLAKTVAEDVDSASRGGLLKPFNLEQLKVDFQNH